MWQCCIISELRTVWQISNPISKELEARDFSRVSVHEELYEKYNDKLPVFFVDDIYKEKYVDLEQNNNPDGE